MKHNMDQIKTFDREHVWHPYTSMTHPLKTYPVESAEGVYIKLMDGTRLIDGMSSWWAAIHGYNHPVLNAAIEQQLKKMSHIMFGGLTHEPAVDLSKLLIDITPATLDKVFLCDSGSVSVEVAIKMALQYWQSLNLSKKNRMITVRNGYHGDTFYAMSVCDPVTGMHHVFKDVLHQHYFADAPGCAFHEPWEEKHLDSIRRLVETHHTSCAAVILEPIVQGAGGMRFYSPEYLKRVKELCTQYDLLLILDEIATGFGRTGEMFACHHAGIEPDILCLGKALTGGYLSLAATLTSDRISRVISEGECKGFMHGPTFMGNPLACSVAAASIRLLLSQDWKKRIQEIESGLINGLSPCKTSHRVKDVRVLGAIGVVEMKQAVDMEKIQEAFVRQGVWIRPFGRLIYTMPPYIMETLELGKLTEAITHIVCQES